MGSGSWLARDGLALSYEPQRLRRSSEAPKVQCQSAPEFDWNGPWLVSCSTVSGGGRLGSARSPLAANRDGRQRERNDREQPCVVVPGWILVPYVAGVEMRRNRETKDRQPRYPSKALVPADYDSGSARSNGSCQEDHQSNAEHCERVVSLGIRRVVSRPEQPQDAQRCAEKEVPRECTGADGYESSKSATVIEGHSPMPNIVSSPDRPGPLAADIRYYQDGAGRKRLETRGFATSPRRTIGAAPVASGRIDVVPSGHGVG